MLRQLFLYSMLALPLAFISLPIYIYAPEFYSRVCEISLAKIGLALLIVRFIDAIQDPILGKLGDFLHHKRMLLIFLGLIVMIFGFLMLFNPSQNAGITWFTISVFLSTTGFSLASINYQAFGGLWAVKPESLTTITSCREAIGLIGLLIMAILPNALSYQLDPKSAFKIISLILPPVAIIGFIGLSLWSTLAKVNKPASSSIKPIINNWSIRFFGVYFLNSFASAIPAILVLFFINDYLLAAKFSGFFLFSYFISAAILMPFWHKMSCLFGKEFTWMNSMILAASTFIWAFLLKPGSTSEYAIICMLSGLALGADLSIPAAIIADHLNVTNNHARASSYFAIMNFCTKFSLALASGMVLPLLSYLGYQPGNSSGVLSYAYALIPSVLKLMAALLLRFYIVRNI